MEARLSTAIGNCVPPWSETMDRSYVFMEEMLRVIQFPYKLDNDFVLFTKFDTSHLFILETVDVSPNSGRAAQINITFFCQEKKKIY